MPSNLRSFCDVESICEDVLKQTYMKIMATFKVMHKSRGPVRKSVLKSMFSFLRFCFLLL